MNQSTFGGIFNLNSERETEYLGHVSTFERCKAKHLAAISKFLNFEALGLQKTMSTTRDGKLHLWHSRKHILYLDLLEVR